MSEQNNESIITPSSPVRLTVGIFITMALSVAYFLYDRDERTVTKFELKLKVHQVKHDEQIKKIESVLERKADAADIKDRFTDNDFRTYSTNQKAEQDQFREFVRLQFTLTEKRNEVEHQALEQRIEHLDDDLNQAVERIDNHYSLRGIP